MSRLSECNLTYYNSTYLHKVKNLTHKTKQNNKKDCDAYFKSNIPSALIYQIKQLMAKSKL